MNMHRLIALSALATLAACADGGVTGSTDGTSTGTATGGTATGGTATGSTATGATSFAISAFDCLEAGVNANPFTVAKALATNTADHDAAADYVWTAASAVSITLNGTSATVSGAGATASGSTVTITSAGTYRVSGTLTNGQLVVNTKDTALVRVVLDGATITNAADAAIFVSKATKAALVLAANSVNRVTDGTTFPTGVDQNAAIFSKANLSIGGAGSLTVTGRFEDGITGKDGLVIDGANVTVTAKDDGIRGKDYLVLRNATLDVTAGGDGLKSDEDGDAKLGYVLVQGTTAKVTSGGDAITAQTDALVASGTLTLKAGGGNAVRIADTLSAKGIKADSSVVIDGGTISIDAADDGLHSNAKLVVNGGTTTIATGDDGVHGELELTVNAGTIDVTKSYEGFEVGAGTMTFNGGRVRIVSTDDGVNVSGLGDNVRGNTALYFLRINGGRLVVNAAGDGLDSNGSMAMSGGCAFVHGPTASNNAPVDYDGTFQITGGLLVAAGSSGMAQQPGTTSTQRSVMLTFAQARAANTLVHIQSASGESIMDFAPSKAFQSLVVSSPKLAAGSYSVYTGGAATSAATDGVYTSGTYSGGTLLNSFTISSMVNRASF